MKSPITYTNRKGKKSYIKKEVTKTGKVRYLATQKARKVDLPLYLTEMPGGYEFYENQESGVVTIREKSDSIFSKKDQKIVKGLFTNKHLLQVFVDQDAIFFYFPDFHFDINHKVYDKKKLPVDFAEYLKFVEYSKIAKLIKKGDFYILQCMGKVISDENFIEVDQSDNLKELLKKYHDNLYKNEWGEFNQKRVLEEKIFTLKITIDGSSPPIYRTIRVNNSIDLSFFSDYLLTIMGWGSFHLSSFEYKKGRDWVMVGNEADDFFEEPGAEEKDPLEEYLLDDFFKDKKSVLKYTYDFGRNWRHLITLQKVEEGTLKHEIECVGGERATPIKDIRGIYSYNYMLEVLQDKSHEEYEYYEAWIDEDFDPNYFSVEEVNEILEKIRKYP